MRQQERALRTRARIVRAAALEMDRSGYEGARLSRVCQVADASMGAVTFHFPTKKALAEAVREEGVAGVDAVVNRALSAGTSRLRAVVDLTVALASLLERDVAARAAARVAREQPDVMEQWSGSWLPTVLDLLSRARADGQLRPEHCPETLAALVVYLLAGAESEIRTGGGAPMGGAGSVADRLEQIWRLVLRGAAAGKF
ncbi:TetR/AcrR family transcriptional regulator [Streptomyces sp. ID05-04B]|uniref:TetR/AcrR family transcriptional regulator n=1 Tax=unclassified Streptomyces TaxID=2593676 RepID=UPI000D1A08A1|nr:MULTISPECIES: TetR/AcrR family transcriptional regulator [unclassified Streptomyces]AVV46712.1 TetR/AcrR family transcriptional regulator [Streptomyces sp. P3]MDX5564239.1 TetR/AcrR family transcriptional regulator [Streptomyces sp. ID05-04B]